MDDRVQLLIERIEKFPEEFEKINGAFTHLKWALWFESHYLFLSQPEKEAVLDALAKAHREMALCNIVTTITDGDTIKPNGVLGSANSHLVINPTAAKILDAVDRTERGLFKGSAAL